jgi:hypothetical protein
MKGIVRDQRAILLTTANITFAGLGISSKPNIECAAVVPMQDESRDWINQIQHEAVLVTPMLFEKFLIHVEKHRRLPFIPVQEFSFSEEAHEGRLSVFEFPSVACPQLLLNGLQKAKRKHGSRDWDRIMRDAEIYGVPISIGPSVNAMPLLRNNFFAKPTISALVKFVADKRYFGEVKRWIRCECDDADTLTNAELIQKVQSLFNWIVELGDGRFRVQRPNFSECLIRV